MEGKGKITIGDYEISYSDILDRFWIRHKSGEGTEVDKEKLEKLIHDFYKENF